MNLQVQIPSSECHGYITWSDPDFNKGLVFGSITRKRVDVTVMPLNPTLEKMLATAHRSNERVEVYTRVRAQWYVGVGRFESVGRSGHDLHTMTATIPEVQFQSLPSWVDLQGDASE